MNQINKRWRFRSQLYTDCYPYKWNSRKLSFCHIWLVWFENLVSNSYPRYCPFHAVNVFNRHEFQNVFAFLLNDQSIFTNLPPEKKDEQVKIGLEINWKLAMANRYNLHLVACFSVNILSIMMFSKLSEWHSIKLGCSLCLFVFLRTILTWVKIAPIEVGPTL